MGGQFTFRRHFPPPSGARLTERGTGVVAARPTSTAPPRLVKWTHSPRRRGERLAGPESRRSTPVRRSTFVSVPAPRKSGKWRFGLAPSPPHRLWPSSQGVKLTPRLRVTAGSWSDSTSTRSSYIVSQARARATRSPGVQTQVDLDAWSTVNLLLAGQVWCWSSQCCLSRSLRRSRKAGTL